MNTRDTLYSPLAHWTKLRAWNRLVLVWLLFFLVPCTAQAAIQFRAATKDVSETVPLTASKPAGTTDGDLLIAFVNHDTASACPCTPPAGQGWTAFSLPGSESGFTSRAWYKQVDAADAPRTDYTFTFTAGDNSAILYLATFYEDSGIGVWTLEDGTGWAFNAAANTLSNGGVTAVDNSLFVVAYGNDDNEVVTTDPIGPTKIDEDAAAGAALAAYFEMVDAIDGSVSYPITWGGSADELSAMAGIFSWAAPDSCPVVTTTADSGPGSLRACINYANGNPGTTISFNIPLPANQASGPDSWWRVSPASALPTILAAGTIIDGTTQTLNQGNTNSVGPEIELDGGGISANGLDVASANNVIKGLIIGGFSGGISAGVRISVFVSTGNDVTGNYIGTDHAGATANANATGILITGGASSNTIGGSIAVERNIISGNLFQGVQITTLGADSNTVTGNYIGSDRTGALALPNGGIGVGIWGSARSNVIGGSGLGQGNVIAFNASDGVWVGSPVSDSNLISGNSIFDNGGLGIDLEPNGVTANNGTKNGSLPNDDMDYPVFTSAVLTGSTLTVSGYVGSAPGQAAFANARVEIFEADDSPANQNGEIIVGDTLNVPHGEGRVYFGFLTADASGNFSGALTASGLALGESITATATDGSNNTSEFGANAIVAGVAADLSLIKTVDNATPFVGSNVVFTLTAGNDGPDDATGVAVTDLLPTGYTYVSDDGGGAYVPGSGVWTIGALAASNVATLNITATVNAAGVYNNTAEVTASDQPDPDSTPDNGITTEDDYAEQATTPIGGPGPPVCQVDPSGTYIEAENFTGTIVQGAATFLVESITPGFNGSGYLRSTGGGTPATPVDEGKIYNIDFTSSGTYNVWMRGYALDGGSDSAFIGLNGASAGALNEGGTYNTWVWTNSIQLGSNQITVPAAGFQDFNTWIREANHRIDGFYLTQGAETPTGGIPPGSPTLDPVQCLQANLALTKTDSLDPVSVGNPFTYTMTVNNTGPTNATNVILVDTLPATVDWQLATPSQGSCVHSGEPLGGTVTCTLGTITNGANATVDIEVVAPNTTGVINNSATVSADEPDPVAGNNTAAEDTTIIAAAADLRVTQIDDFDPSGVNLDLIYTVTVTNQGPAGATLVTMVDTLDGAVTYQSAVPSQGSCAEAGGIVTCDMGGLANGSSATIIITVTAPATPQTVTNTTVVSATEPDPDLNDNTWLEDTDVINPPPANLELTMTDSPDPVAAGSPLTYTLTVNNLGPGPATLVEIIDTLPAGVTFVSATPDSGSCSEAGGIVDCDLGTITNNASRDVVIVVTAPAVPGLITNNAVVSTDRIDPFPANDSASADTTVTVVGEADLALSKSDSPDPVLVNQSLSYSLVVDNLGPDDAIDVVLVDTLPATVAYQSVITSQGACVHSGEALGGTVTCTLGMIANAANAMVDIIVTAPPSAGSITNNASVSATSSDLNAGNDNASENTTVENFNVNQLCYLVADAGGGGGGNDLLTQIDTADFDPVTNETNIGIGTGTNSIEAIAWNSATMVLYGANAGQLGILSTVTGVFTALPQTFGTGSGVFGNITFTDVDGLSYDATTGILYGSERQGGTDVLIQINMATGAHVPNAFGAGLDYVPIVPIGGNTITDDIAVDPTTGVMYASTNQGGASDLLIIVDKFTGLTSSVGVITVPDIEGLGTDSTGQLWGTSGTQRILYELDKNTAVGSNGRSIDNGSDYESVDCFAFSPSVIADLAVTKIVDNAAPIEGATVSYTVSVTNNGPATATVAQLTDLLPVGVTFVLAMPSQGTYDSGPGSWFIGNIAAGATATLTLQASVDAGTAGSTITNTASISFLSQHDPNAGNDTASIDIVPVDAPNIVITKTVLTVEDPFNLLVDPKAIPGSTVLYTVTLTNTGGSAADVDSVFITEPVPADTALRVIDFDGGNAGPVAFVDVAPLSGLTYTFVDLSDPGDDVEFSNDGGVTYTYTPVADANGVDTTVTHMRINPKGAFLSGSPANPTFDLLFKNVVQ